MKIFHHVRRKRVYSLSLDEVLKPFANGAHALRAMASRRKTFICSRGTGARQKQPVNEENRRTSMKKLIMALALAAATAAPAFAATHHKKMDDASGAYAAATDSNVVVVDGKVVGADPDANVRLNLRRDPDLEAN
jgi:ferric-dicitrate binding protein FerR (iron transport regulator)